MKITIKRRLQISNILMTVIPLLLSLLFISVMMFLIFDISDERMPQITSLTGIQRGETPPETIIALDTLQHDGFTFYELPSGQSILVFPEGVGKQFAEVDWDGPGLYAEFLIVPSGFSQLAEFERFAQIGFFLLLVLLALGVNYFLVKFVFRPIKTSLNVLTEGVHEIAVGNLDYRINQQLNNEFDVVSSNFNEMAFRLSDMVEQRKNDEANRKELIAGMAHDLRTPLTSIRTYAEALELGAATTPEIQQKYLKTIISKSNDMEHILNQLFLFSKLDTGEFPLKLHKCYIEEWLCNFIREHKDEYLAKGLHFQLKIATTRSLALIDQVQFGAVILNILENAVKYAEVEQIVLTIETRQMGDRILIVVTDNGKGVAKEDLKQLFTIFYRTDKSRSNPSIGSGLGLAIAAKIIRLMTGEVWAETATDGGLSITIQLPITKE